MDLIKALAERRLEIAYLTDRGKLTEQQEQLQMKKALGTVQEIERLRNSGGR